MPIPDRTAVKPGVTLVAVYKKQEYLLHVTLDAGGGRVFKFPDGRTFPTPSAAGSAVMGGIACNGWRFWSLEGQLPVHAPRQKKETTTQGIRTRTPGKMLKRLGQTEDTPKGLVTWFCSGCMDSFDMPAHKTPKECPEGHTTEGFGSLEFDLSGSDDWLQKNGLERAVLVSSV